MTSAYTTILATHINGNGRIPTPIPSQIPSQIPSSHPICHNPIPIPNPIPISNPIPNPIPNPKSHPKSQIPSQIPFKSHLNPVIVEGQKYHHSNRLVETSRMVVDSSLYDHWMPS